MPNTDVQYNTIQSFNRKNHLEYNCTMASAVWNYQLVPMMTKYVDKHLRTTNKFIEYIEVPLV